MSRDKRRKQQTGISGEQHTRPELDKRGGQLSVCLVYPNGYRIGMSSLGFQRVYELFGEIAGIQCERAFLPDSDGTKNKHGGTSLLSLESKRSLRDFDIIAFSTSFEPDYINIPTILSLSSLPLLSSDRNVRHPLVIAGGAAFFINPEPAADYLDAICIGEAEEILPKLAAALFTPGSDTRADLLQSLSQIPGVYVPALYHPVYRGNALLRYEHDVKAPYPVRRISADLDRHPPAMSVILSDETEFNDMFLIEVSRGCPRGCRFCSSGFVYGAFRQQPYEELITCVDHGLTYRSKIGLVGAAVSDYQKIGDLCRYIVDKGAKVSVSSLRIDRMDRVMLDALVSCGHKTISLAPEGGSQRLRDMIRKNLTEEQILSACEQIIACDILNLKLYFIIGLPTETDQDLEELLTLVTSIRARVIEKARGNKRLGEITLSINPFIPKPFTPFQWCGMELISSLERKVKWLDSRIRSMSNVRLKVESLRESYLQALLSRGDRRLTPLLTAISEGNSLKNAARQSGINTDWYVHRVIPTDEPLPWNILTTTDESLLIREYANAGLSRGEQG